MIPAAILYKMGEISKPEYDRMAKQEEEERVSNSFFSDSPDEVVRESEKIDCGSVYFMKDGLKCDIDADKRSGVVRVSIFNKRLKSVFKGVFNSSKDAFEVFIGGTRIRDAIKGERIYRAPFIIA